SSTSGKRQINDEEDDEGEGFGFTPPQSMTIHVSGFLPSSNRPARQAVITPTQRNSLSGRRKVFFEEVVNLPSPTVPSSSEGPSEPSVRPRLIYIRDYHTLAAYRHIWFGALLSAVRARRQGPINRASSPVANPMVIIYGFTPPLMGSNGTSSTSAGANEGEADQ